MNWKKEAEGALRDYVKKQQALDNIPDLIKQLDIEMRRIRQNMTSGEHNTWNDLYIENVVRRNELERNLALTAQRVTLIERGLGSISLDERRLLELFFIDRPEEHVQSLCGEFGYEKSSIYGKKDAALRRFTLAMYGADDRQYKKLDR